MNKGCECERDKIRKLIKERYHDVSPVRILHKNFKTIYIGFMRMITFNFKLLCKPVELGWRRKNK